MVMALIRIYDVNRLVAALEPVLNERKQHAILFVFAVEERTYMTRFAEVGAGKGNGRRGRFHDVLLLFRYPAALILQGLDHRAAPLSIS